MIIRVALGLALAAAAMPATAAGPSPALSYDITGFLPPPPRPFLHRQALAYDLDNLVFDRVPDHMSLGYRVRGLNGDYVRPYRTVREVGPLPYDFDNLVLLPDFGASLIAAGSP
ncbi:hypothetical protein [uncultured Parasphingopyxis sp.]|uniref:hypothetical protein n=1 Tax=uncultured Parasphingopyxis sp. TaxID=1547918 RepID=UPI002606425F|nr:hypothetical protein [uncultured Parasphingopyxis sp.]